MSNRIAVNKHELSSDLTRNLMAIKTDTLEKGVQHHRIASQWKVKLTASCPISLDMIGQLEVSRRAARDPWWPVVKPWSLVSVLMWASLFASSQYIPWNMGKVFFEKWELSWCRVCHHWWHCRLSERQPRNDNLQCHQWCQSWHHDKFQFSVFVVVHFVVVILSFWVDSCICPYSSELLHCCFTGTEAIRNNCPNGSDVIRAHSFLLPNAPRQVKLPVGQVDLSKFLFSILYKQIEELQNSIGQASKNIEKGSWNPESWKNMGKIGQYHTM